MRAPTLGRRLVQCGCGLVQHGVWIDNTATTEGDADADRGSNRKPGAEWGGAGGNQLAGQRRRLIRPCFR